MFKKMLAVFLILVLPAGVAAADVQAELAGSLESGASISDTVESMLGSSPDNAEEIIAAAIGLSPAETGEIVAAAIRAGISVDMAILAAISQDVDQAGSAVAAAVALAPDKEDEIVQAAILAGADPTTVAAATAAGRAPPSPFAPAVMPNVGIGQGGVTPFGVGIVVGGNPGSTPIPSPVSPS